MKTTAPDAIGGTGLLFKLKKQTFKAPKGGWSKWRREWSVKGCVAVCIVSVGGNIRSAQAAPTEGSIQNSAPSANQTFCSDSNRYIKILVVSGATFGVWVWMGHGPSALYCVTKKVV